MAVKKRSTYRKRRKAKPSKSTDRQSNVVKSEIYGLLLIAVGILLGLAILSYHQGDPTGFLEENNIYQVKNWLGIFGATIAAPLFQWTLGYPILFLPIVIILGGFYLLLKKPLKSFLRISALLFSWSLFLSVVLAAPEALRTFGNFQSFYPSGFVGGVIAAYLVKFFSKFGALFIITILFLILVVVSFHLRISTIPLFIGRGIGRSANWIGNLLKQMISSLRVKKSGRAKPIRTREETVHPAESKEKAEEMEPLYQPSLPSEKDQFTYEPKPPIEIIHSERRREEEKSAPSTRMPGEAAVSSPGLEKKTGETKPVEKEGLGFEVQEAHQEKELDYDALVRDSLSKYQFPSTDLLNEQPEAEIHLSEAELKGNARLLEETLAQFGVRAMVNRVVEGPVITLYEVKPAQGVKISQIVGLTDDLALAMRAKGIRMIAPIPGKAAIGIEIPNRKASPVYFRSIVRSETFINYRGNLVLGMGKTISGEVYCADLTKMPHLLMAGATGSGKSVGINTMIASLLYRVPPSDLKFVLIDPKKLELSIYAKLKDHYLASCPELDEIVITHPQNAIMILRSVVNEMEERYDKLAAMGVREVTHYNQKIEEYQKNGESSDTYRKLPYIVVVIDELADLILSAAREVEEPITRLAQMARAVGIHLIMATQRPSVDILTGLIKANFPARIAYQVATRPDSKVILDMYGAERLIGNGDMLFLPPGKVKPLRIQNPLITTEEVERIIKHIRKQPKFPPYELKLVRARTTSSLGATRAFEYDELFEQARDIVIRYQQGSVSLLQRSGADY